MYQCVCESLFASRSWTSHEISAPGSLGSPQGRRLGERLLQEMKFLGIWLLPSTRMIYDALIHSTGGEQRSCNLLNDDEVSLSSEHVLFLVVISEGALFK